jgi:hypothetical protein
VFDGCVPTELRRLKKIYLRLWRLSLAQMHLAADMRDAELPDKFCKRAESLEYESNEILHLFDGVLTKEEQKKLRDWELKRRDRKRG